MKETHFGNRLLALVLSLCMAFAMLPLTAIPASAEPYPTWNGGVDMSWYFSHEEDETYEIQDGDDLAGLMALVNGTTGLPDVEAINFSGKTLILTQNISLGNKPWKGIGDYPDSYPGHMFSGTFDGNGKTIYDMNKTTFDVGGIFGSTSGATIKGLTVENVILDSGYSTGPIVGEAYATLIENCTTKNVSVIDYTLSVTGGLAGRLLEGSTARNCHSEKVAIVSDGDLRCTGGLLGIAADSTVDGCTASGVVQTSVRGGGLIGLSDGATVTNCSAAVDVYCASTRDETFSFAPSVGGLIGVHKGGGRVDQCFATGNVRVSLLDANGGGLIGWNSAQVSCSYATGSVTSTRSNSTLGGLVGLNGWDDSESPTRRGEVWECYATGNVDGTSCAQVNAGGLIGKNEYTVNNCYSTGNVTAGNGSRPEVRAGALIGEQRPHILEIKDDNDKVVDKVEYDGAKVTNSYATGNVFVKKLGIGTSGRASGIASSYEKGTIEHCVALGQSVEIDGNFLSSGIAPGSYDEQSRIGSKTATLSYNYARSDMTVDGKTKSDDANISGVQGGNIPIGSTQLWGSWFSDWDAAQQVWDFSYKDVAFYPGIPLPTLKNVGGRQNPILPPGNGSGSEYHWYSPNLTNFVIETPAQLKGLADLVNGNTVLGTVSFEGKNIVLKPTAALFSMRGYENWEPIGKDADHAFQGYVKSSLSYPIVDLTSHQADDKINGLFGYVGNKATIQGIALERADLEGGKFIGALAGENAGTITGCSAKGTVTTTGGMSQDDQVFGAGGLVGRMSAASASIADSSATVTLNCTRLAARMGGLLGYSTGGTVTNSSAHGSVYNRAGGRVSPYSGGLIGYIETTTVSGCRSSGKAEANGGSVGGLIGSMQHSSVSACNTVAIASSTGLGNVGGFVGFVSGDTSRIRDCYALGDVSGGGTTGGFVGTNTSGSIERCYAAGSVQSSKIAGGIAGLNQGALTHCVAMNRSLLNEGEQPDQIGAVAGQNAKTISDCYARGDMIINHAVQPSVLGDGGTPIPYGAALDWTAYFGTLSEAGWNVSESKTMEYNTLLPYLENGSKREIECVLNGLGTEQKPYMLDTAEDLVHLRELVNKCLDFKGKTIQMHSSIMLPDENWTPIGVDTPDGQRAFNGKLNGNRLSIGNLKVDAGDYAGLFGIIGRDGAVCDLGLNAAQVSGGNYTGILAGLNRGQVNRCYTNGSVNGKSYTGGIAGWQDGEIYNGYSTASVSGGEFVGGVVGQNEGQVMNTYATGRVEGQNNVGGIAGENKRNLSNSVAFNSRVDASAQDGFAARAGKGTEGFNNFARGDMYVNGQPVEKDPDQSGDDGITIGRMQALDWSTWFNQSIAESAWMYAYGPVELGSLLPTLKIEAEQQPVIPAVATNVDAPVFSKAAGIYFGTQQVEITCGTEKATIYYTIDGSDPTTSDTRMEYSGPITIDRAATLKAYAVRSGLGDSLVTEAEYLFKYSLNVYTSIDPDVMVSYQLLPGESANIIASDPKNGYAFDGWEMLYGEGEFGDPNEMQTTFTIGEADTEVRPSYKDVAAPTGEAAIAGNSWTEFLNNITFGLFFKETQEVTITAQDNSGEAPQVEYFLSQEPITSEQVQAGSWEWLDYQDKITLDPDGEFIVYARLTDAAGNCSYLSTDGLVLDATPPAISGAEDGQTYERAVTVTMTDPHLAQITLNGEEQPFEENTGSITLNQSGDYTVAARDHAGNESSMTLRVELPAITGVAVSPETVSVQKGLSQTFTASVTGTGEYDQSVIWSVEGAQSEATQIDENGLLTVGADETAHSLTVRATSAADERVSGAASVTVTEAPGVVDKSILQKVIDKAKLLIQSEEFDHAISSVQKSFEDTLAEAKRVNENPSATQPEVDQAWISLMTEIHKLGLVQGNKDTLKEHIELYSSLNMDEYEDGDAKETFLKALQAAREMLDNNDAVQSEIDACDNALVAAAQLLARKANKETLQSIVNLTLDYREENYAKGWDEFASARSTAQELLESSDVTQEQLDQAANRLLDAMMNLRYKANKDLLLSLISRAETFDPSAYSAEQIQAFASALDDARKAASDQTLSSDEQETVNQAAEKLQAAMERMTGTNIEQSGIRGQTTHSAKTGDASAPISCTAFFVLTAIGMLVSRKRKN